MEYFALYPKKGTAIQKLQRADLFYNADLIAMQSDDYSWNTTLAKRVNLPKEFWLVLDTANITFDYAKYSTLFLLSDRFFHLIYEHCSQYIQYAIVHIIDGRTKAMLDKSYYFVKFNIDKDWIDYDNSIYETKYDYITQRTEIIKYSSIKLKDIQIDKDVFLLKNNILGHILYISSKIADEIVRVGLDKSVHIVPLKNVAEFHNEYYFL